LADTSGGVLLGHGERCLASGHVGALSRDKGSVGLLCGQGACEVSLGGVAGIQRRGVGCTRASLVVLDLGDCIGDASYALRDEMLGAESAENTVVGAWPSG